MPEEDTTDLKDLLIANQRRRIAELEQQLDIVRKFAQVIREIEPEEGI